MKTISVKRTAILGSSCALILSSFMTSIPAMAAESGTPTDVNSCVANLQYDPNRILTHRAPAVENLPATSTEVKDGVYTVVTREKKTIDNPQKQFSSSGLNTTDIYPGALLAVNESLLDNRPVVLPVERPANKPLTISADLPGPYDSSAQVDGSNPAQVNQGIARILESWNAKAAPSYGTQAARVVFNEQKLTSKQQGEAAFGGSFNAAIAKIGVDFSTLVSGEKQLYVTSLQQIFYTVSMNPPKQASDLVANKSAKVVCNGKTVPGYISSVDYGRQIYVFAQSDARNVDLKAALSVAVKGQEAKLSTRYQDALNKSDIKAVVLGGSAKDQIKVTSGNIDEIRKVISEGATYSRLNPAVPINYTVKFLKDNSLATSRSVAEYYETTVKSYTSSKLQINHKGGYVAQYFISWDEITGFDKNGTPILAHREWEGNGKGRTSGAQDLIALPANARNVTIKIRECTGLVWNWWRTIVDEKNLALVPERTITIYGTTLHPKTEMVVK